MTDGAVGLDQVKLGTSEASERQTGGLAGWLHELFETLLLAGFIWLAVNFATARFVVDGNSMEPNFHTGEFVIVSRLAYIFGQPQRGDIVVFRFPNNPDNDYIKRIVGLPGDRVEVREGRVYVNQELLQEHYITMPAGYSGVWNMVKDEYFVLGDNRNESSDSHNWGGLDGELMVGRAWLIYWPPREWGLVLQQTYAGP